MPGGFPSVLLSPLFPQSWQVTYLLTLSLDVPASTVALVLVAATLLLEPLMLAALPVLTVPVP